MDWRTVRRRTARQLCLPTCFGCLSSRRAMKRESQTCRRLHSPLFRLCNALRFHPRIFSWDFIVKTSPRWLSWARKTIQRTVFVSSSRQRLEDPVLRWPATAKRLAAKAVTTLRLVDASGRLHASVRRRPLQSYYRSCLKPERIIIAQAPAVTPK